MALCLLKFQALVFSHGRCDEITHIHFVEEANWPPFTPDTFGKTTDGLSYQLMNEIFSRLKISIDLELVPQQRMLMYLKDGLKDYAIVISKNSERLTYIEFSEPISQKNGFIYYLVNRKKPFIWNDYEDLKGLRIGVVSGHNYGEEFDNAVSRYDLHVDYVTSEDMNFKKLINHRIDVLLCVELTANEILKHPEFKGLITHASKTYYSKNYHIGFSKHSKAVAIIPQVNQVIRQMKKDGSLTKIVYDYIEQ